MKIHLIAIGGSAMHNLALALQEAGHTVSGSDDEVFEPSRSRLQKADLMPSEIGWFPERITSDLDLVILGMHARADNPELQRAQELGLKILSYPEFLYEHSKNKTRVVIAGSHGKTTVTSMIMHVCRLTGLDIDYMVGAQVHGFDTMVRLSESAEFMVIEGDEYPASALQMIPKFHFYTPNITAITGIAWDHANVFSDERVYIQQFRTYLEICEPGAAVVYNAEDLQLADLLSSTTKYIKKIPYSLPKYKVAEDGTYFIETEEGLLPLSVIGKHNMANLEAARWICQLMGIQEMDFYQAIQSFQGAARRLQLLGSKGGRSIYLDFAHSPSKVRATLDSFREAKPAGKIVAVLELHTYSSLSRSFIPQYRHTMNSADIAIVYFNPKSLAHKRLPDLSAEDVAKAFQIPETSVFTDAQKVFDRLKSLKDKQLDILFMTSGNFAGENLEKWAEELLQA